MVLVDHGFCQRFLKIRERWLCFFDRSFVIAFYRYESAGGDCSIEVSLTLSKDMRALAVFVWLRFCEGISKI